jgi:hypothetical protein
MPVAGSSTHVRDSVDADHFATHAIGEGEWETAHDATPHAELGLNATYIGPTVGNRMINFTVRSIAA